MTSPNHPANQTEALALQFLETAASLERGLDRALSYTRGVSFSEYRLLRTLSTAPTGALPRIDLANAVGLTASAVTRALKPLEKLGYVTTEKSERDARQSLARLTSGGHELLSDAKGILGDYYRQLPLDSLDTDSVEQIRSQLINFRATP